MRPSSLRHATLTLTCAALVFFSPGAARAWSPGPGVKRLQQVSRQGPTTWLAKLLSSLNESTSSGVDPHGDTSSSDNGSGLDPDGRPSTTDNGPGLDPDGRT